MNQMLRFSRELRRIAPAGNTARATVPRISVTEAATGASEREPEPAPLPPAPPKGDLDPLIEAATDPVTDEHAVESAQQAYNQLVNAAQLAFDAAAAKAAPDGPATVAAVRRILDLLGEGDELLAVTVRQRTEAHSWARSSANVAILAMRVGLEIDYDERRALAIGLCGIMHDVGMLLISEEAMTARRFDAKQLELLHKHPAESQRIVQSFGKAFDWIGKVVVQVHERHDGSGYPAGIEGEEIHEFARIIGLVDTYEAMAQPRADREAKVVYNALKEMIDLRNTLFEHRLIKALITIVSIFPLGSLVKLNNGEIGRVVATSVQHPTRPTLDILVDPRGRPLNEHRSMKLEDEPMLFIVDPAIEEGVLRKKKKK